MKILLFIFVAIVHQTAFSGEYYFSANLASFHFNRAEKDHLELNEINPGIGLERESGDWRQMLGAYRNSLNASTVYALAGYSPISYGGAKAGLIGGAVTGYEVSIAPAFGLLFTYQHEHAGVNIIVVPNAHIMHKEVHGFVGFQLRYKLY